MADDLARVAVGFADGTVALTGAPDASMEDSIFGRTPPKERAEDPPTWIRSEEHAIRQVSVSGENIGRSTEAL